MPDMRRIGRVRFEIARHLEHSPVSPPLLHRCLDGNRTRTSAPILESKLRAKPQPRPTGLHALSALLYLPYSRCDLHRQGDGESPAAAVPSAATFSTADTDSGIAGLKHAGAGIAGQRNHRCTGRQEVSRSGGNPYSLHRTLPAVQVDEHSEAAPATGGGTGCKLMTKPRKPTGCGIDDTGHPLQTSAE